MEPRTIAALPTLDELEIDGKRGILWTLKDVDRRLTFLSAEFIRDEDGKPTRVWMDPLMRKVTDSVYVLDWHLTKAEAAKAFEQSCRRAVRKRMREVAEANKDLGKIIAFRKKMSTRRPRKPQTEDEPMSSGYPAISGKLRKKLLKVLMSEHLQANAKDVDVAYGKFLDCMRVRFEKK